MKIVPRVIAPQINPPGPRPAPTESVATDSFGGSIKTAATRLVAGSPEGALAVLRETQKIFSPDQGITLLTGPGSKLTMRGGETGVELGWRN